MSSPIMRMMVDCARQTGYADGGGRSYRSEDVNLACFEVDGVDGLVSSCEDKLQSRRGGAILGHPGPFQSIVREGHGIKQR